MWRTAGLLRDEQTLREGLYERDTIEVSLHRIAKQNKNNRRLFEAQSLLAISRAILLSALARTESRGAHYRNDYHQRDNHWVGMHSVLGGEGLITFDVW
jgi:succinate dehydrogenase/fumarate reductase flavoprotein subunit